MTLLNNMIKKVVQVLLAWLVYQSAYAWGPLGHQVVCDIAWQASTPQVRRQLSDAARRMGYKTYASSCIWADQLKKKARYDYLKPLHYVNVARGSESLSGAGCLSAKPLDNKNKKSSTQSSKQSPKQQPRCVVDAITYHYQRFTQPSLSQRERDKALLFLGHWLGDIHQPLHVSYRDDLGGNRRKVIFDGQVSSLHRVWDSQLLYCRYRGDWRTLGKQLFSRPPPKQRLIFDKGDNKTTSPRRLAKNVTLWANESLALTRKIYAELPANNTRYLSQHYCQQYHPIVLNRLQLAGLRLGRLLAVGQ